MCEYTLYTAIKNDRKLMNKLTWEAANGKTKAAEEAAFTILGHAHRSARFRKLFPEESPSALQKEVTKILKQLKDWEEDSDA